MDRRTKIAYATMAVMLMPVGIVLVYADYKAPTNYQTANSRVITNAGQGLELQVRLIDGKPNPNFTKYRNASSRIWLKNKDAFRILVEVNGVVLDVPLATGTASCPADKRQPVFVRVRIEDEATEPAEPVIEVIP